MRMYIYIYMYVDIDMYVCRHCTFLYVTHLFACQDMLLSWVHYGTTWVSEPSCAGLVEIILSHLDHQSTFPLSSIPSAEILRQTCVAENHQIGHVLKY